MPKHSRTLKIGESITIEERDGTLTTITLLSVDRGGHARFSYETEKLPQVDLDIRANEANHAGDAA